MHDDLVLSSRILQGIRVLQDLNWHGSCAGGKFKLQVGAAGSEARRRYGGKFEGHIIVCNLQSLVICRTVSKEKWEDPSDTACTRTC